MDTGPDKQNVLVQNGHYFFIAQFKHVFWVLIETVLLSTNNIGFGKEIRKIIFKYILLSGDLDG